MTKKNVKNFIFCALPKQEPHDKFYDERDKAKAKTNPFVLGFLRKPLTFDSIRRIVSENNMVEQKT